MEFLEACRHLIGIDSSPTAGTLQAARFVRGLAASFGFHAELFEEQLNGVEQANLVIRVASPSHDQNEFLLQTHLDTPDPGSYALWTKTGHNPFNASIYQDADGDRLYGLGAADTKLDFLCKLYALKEVKLKLSQSKDTYSPVLAATYGEELGMSGAVKLIRKKQIRAKLALVGEPTSNSVVASGKGFARVQLTLPFSPSEQEFRLSHDLSESASSQSRIFHGVAGHSSNPEVGDSAIDKLFAALAQLPSGVALLDIDAGVNFNTIPAHSVLEIDMFPGVKDSMIDRLLRLKKAMNDLRGFFALVSDSRFSPPMPTLNLGTIRTQESHVVLNGCVRVIPQVSLPQYETWMNSFKSECEAIGGRFEIIDYKPPFETSLDSVLAVACKQVLLDQSRDGLFQSQSVTNEANVFSKFGINVLAYGPGQGVGNSHAPNEYVKIKDLESAREFYQQILLKQCSST